ncbi:hypothetical protein SteCoe_37443 [Stentor coeruleus]|uniref:Peptidase S1 domain-containing protein n=1 Tax=Stentor coeruleus TaxID=5963 RepID=A0A1R2AMZ7_9CILI|nr:hypothetical protein SteCoe_37443 [Stentor coeruleus]
MEFYIVFHVFDFAIPLAIPLNGGRKIKKTQILDVSDAAFPSVIYIEGCNPPGACGSGVVIAKRQTPIVVNGQAYSSLALTAGNVIGKSIRVSLPSMAIVNNYSNASNGQFTNAIILNDFSDIKHMPLLDPVTNTRYALPNNIGLLALHDDIAAMIQPMPICNDLRYNDQFFIAGYPLKPSTILYCSPCLKDRPKSEYIKKINNAFCGFGRKIFSTGTSKKFKTENEYLLACDYSATSGMSGAPVYVQRHGEPHLVGINIGGCSLPYQYEIVKIIHKILIAKFDRAKAMISDLFTHIQASSLYNYSEIAQFDFIKTFDIENDSEFACGLLAKILNMLSIAFNNPLDLSHNLSLPVWSPVFDEIRRIIRNFDAMPLNTSFSTSEDFFLELSK